MKLFKIDFMFFLVFFLCLFVCFFKINDYDIFWHLKIGNLFFDTGKILDSNRFSWTAPEYPWVPSYWLFEAILYVFFKYFDFTGLIVLNGVIHGITWGSLASYTSRFARSGFVLFLFLVALDASLFHFMLRPHVFSFLGISLLIQILDPVRQGRLDSGVFWKGMILFCLWANLHSGVVFGLAYLGLFLGLKILEERFSRESMKYAVLFWVCACSSLVNPNGALYLSYVFDHLSMDRVIPLEELQPLSFTLHKKYAAFMGFFFVLSLLLTLPVKKERLFSLSLLGLSAYLLGKGIRFIPVAFLFCIPSVCMAVQNHPALKKREPDALKSRIFLALLACLYVWHTHTQVFTLPGNYYRSGFGLHEESFPLKASEFLPQGPGVRLYNSFTVGGYLIWRFDEKVKVFQDGRIHAYPADWFRRIESAKRDPSIWKRLIEEFQINVVLISKSEDPTHFWEDLKKSGWQILFEDENFFVGSKS